MELVVIAPYTHTHTHTFICIFKFRQRVYEATIFMDRHYIRLKDNFSRMLPGLWKQPSLSFCISPWLSHHLHAYTTSLLTPPLAHFTLTPPPCSHHFPAHTTPCSLYSHTIPCSLYSHTISLLTLLSHHPLLILLSHHLPAHTTSVWHQVWGWEVPTPSSPLWPQLGVLWLNSVLKTQSYI